jgi:hypothetical protein
MGKCLFWQLALPTKITQEAQIWATFSMANIMD